MKQFRTRKLKKTVSFLILTATLSNSFLPLYAQTLDIQQQIALLGATSNVHNEIKLDDTLIETLRTIASLADDCDEAPALFRMLEQVNKGYTTTRTESVIEILDNEALMLLEKHHAKIADDAQLENLIKNLDTAWQLIASDHISSSSAEESTQTRRQKIEKIFYLYVQRTAEIRTLFVNGDTTINENLRVYGSASINGVTHLTDLTIGGNQTINGSLTVNGSVNLPSGTLEVHKLELFEDINNGANFITLKAPASLAADYTLTLPPDAGIINQVLITDGSGDLGWGTVSFASNTFVNGGNSFGVLTTLGTNDAFGLNLKTNGVARMQISSTGAITVPGSFLADGGIDVTEAGGTDILNIGTTNADIINLGTATTPQTINIGTGAGATMINLGGTGDTVTIAGTLTIINTTNLDVADKLITVNVGGPVSSGFNSGIQIQENGINTGYAKTDGTATSWLVKAPVTTGIITLTPGAAGFTLNQGSHDPITLGTANGLSLVGQVLSLALSSTSTTGALNNTDWNSFNNKAGSFPTNSGTATPSTGALTIAGGSNINTSGAGSTVTITLNNSPSVSGSLTAGTTVTAGTGVIATTGGLTATAGGLTVTADGANITGTTTINTTGAAATSLATGGTGVLNLGNSTGNTFFTGNTTLQNQGQLRLQNTAGTFTAALQAPSLLAANYTLTLPVDAGILNQVLTTNGSGVLGWGTVAFASNTFSNGGNSFGSLAILGTNDAFGLNFETNGVARIQTTNTGAVSINAPNSGIALAVTGNGASTAQTITAAAGQVALDITNGNINLTNSSATTGNITKNGALFIHNIGNQNTFVGATAGNVSLSGPGLNTGIGSLALLDLTTGSDNTAVGQAALTANTTGSDNTAIGLQTISINTTGVQNTGVGASSLANSNGDRNTAMGFRSLVNTTSGSDNVALGFSAGSAQTTGSGNIYIGSGQIGTAPESFVTRIGNFIGTPTTACFIDGINGASLGATANIVGIFNNHLGTTATTFTLGGSLNLVNSTTTNGNILKAGIPFIHNFGTNNTFTGINAGNLTTLAGVNNAGFGYQVLESLTTGNDNVAIGANAGGFQNTGSGNIYVGSGQVGITGESFVTRIGNVTGNPTSSCFIGGIRGVTTGVANAISVLVDSNGQLGITSSSRRYKANIVSVNNIHDNFMALNPVAFNYKSDDSHTQQYGLIAEEVEPLFPELVVYNQDGEVETVKYHLLDALYIKMIQELQHTIQALQHTVEQLNQRIQMIEQL